MKTTERITRPTSQREAVIAQFQKTGSINTHEAFEKFGITRLSSCIFNLKKEGFKISAERRSGKSKFGFPCQYFEYSVKSSKPSPSRTNAKSAPSRIVAKSNPSRAIAVGLLKKLKAVSSKKRA